MIDGIYKADTKIKTLVTDRKSDTVINSVLKARGIEDIESYLNPESQPLFTPFAFSDTEKAVSIIKSAIENKETILIWGDFDADGVTSTSILYKALTALGANFIYFMPDRKNLGHGINLKELLKLKAKNNVKVLITVDCGISNAKEIELIKSMGVKVIITDHHEPPEILPNADCILNPIAPNSLKNSLSFKEINHLSYLSGAGVAFKLATALLGENFKEIQNEILAFAAVGTIADVVPLIGENRIIAAKGLEKINEGASAGISLLFSKLNFDKKIKSEDIAFILAPRINSAGRLTTPNDSIQLLIEDNPHSLNLVIEKLNNLNSIRQGLCDKIYEEALSMLKRPKNAIVLFNKEWHLGIIGIVASKLVEKFNLPVFLITQDEKGIYRSSARGIKGYDISKILSEMKDMFLGYGGHALAGGFSADSNIITIDNLINKIHSVILDYKQDDSKEASIIADIELTGNDINFELINEIDKMEPFGANNEKPKFLFSNCKVISQRTIGKEGNHLVFSVLKDNEQFNCLYWKRKILGFEPGELIDFVFKLDFNTFNGESRIQLITENILNDRLQDSFYSAVKLFDHREKTGILDKINEYVKKKNGEVKIWAPTVSTKKLLSKYQSIKENILENNSCQKTVMFFDFPVNKTEFRDIVKEISPDNIHLMNSHYSKNPDDYIQTLCGMLKYASNNKNGIIDIHTMSNALGLSETAVQILLEILEKIESIRIDDIDKFCFLKAPNKDSIYKDSMYEIFKDEFDKVINFKEYLKTAELTSIEELCRK